MSISAATYAGVSSAPLVHKLISISIQLNKLDKFCKWSGMDLSAQKCAIIGCPNKSRTKPEQFKIEIHQHNISYKNQPISILHQNKPYVYLGIHLIPSLKWKIQTHMVLKISWELNQMIVQDHLLLEHYFSQNKKVASIFKATTPTSNFSEPN